MPVALLVVGCADLGERATSGKCPFGQTCSDETPLGLEFDGTSLSDVLLDGGVHPTAVGGTQDITVYDHQDGQPLSLFYTARFEDASGRPTLGQRVNDTVGNRLGVEAEAAGSELLALRDGTGALLDRLAIAALPVERVSLRASSIDGELLEDDTAPFVAWAGAPLRLAIALEAAGGQRLVDTSLAARGTGVTAQAWDTVDVVATDDVAIEVTGGSLDAPRTLALPVASEVTEMTGASLVDPNPVVGRTDVFCFHAKAEGGEIVGIPWAFSVEGTASLSGAFFRNCTSVDYLTPGRLVVIGSVPGGHAMQIVLEVAPGNARVAPPPAKRLGTLGERAADISRE